MKYCSDLPLYLLLLFYWRKLKHIIVSNELYHSWCTNLAFRNVGRPFLLLVKKSESKL